MSPPRHPSYYLVAGIDLRRELGRLRGLPVFATGPLARSAPELKVRRARRRPNRLGFAVPGEWRLSITDYPGIRPADALETLLHELCHLDVGRGAGAHAWHGREFKLTLAAAMTEAYGVRARCRATAYTGPTRRRSPASSTGALSCSSPSSPERRLRAAPIGN